MPASGVFAVHTNVHLTIQAAETGSTVRNTVFTRLARGRITESNTYATTYEPDIGSTYHRGSTAGALQAAIEHESIAEFEAGDVIWPEIRGTQESLAYALEGAESSLSLFRVG
ncbi:MAG: hypothetical protein OXH70_21805 [Acidobacteria bacterium]|nr:hypothetical protein [Acidobacteriota bacterium]